MLSCCCWDGDAPGPEHPLTAGFCSVFPGLSPRVQARRRAPWASGLSFPIPAVRVEDLPGFAAVKRTKDGRGRSPTHRAGKLGAARDALGSPHLPARYPSSNI